MMMTATIVNNKITKNNNKLMIEAIRIASMNNPDLKNLLKRLLFLMIDNCESHQNLLFY